MKLRELFTRRSQNTNDRGFNMLELIMVVVVIGILGGIGFAIYANVSDSARGTVLDSNIATAAEELVGLLEVNPTAANDVDDLAAAMTNRTNFVWEHTNWEYQAGDEPDVIRFQLLTDGGPTVAATGTPGTAPQVGWLADLPGAAIRIHAVNAEQQWRCALIVRHVSKTALDTGLGTTPTHGVINAAGTAAGTAPSAALAAAELVGTWYDGGLTATEAGLHDCSPVGQANGTCLVGGTPADSDKCLPDTANSWNVPDTADHTDPTSTASSFTANTRRMRTLHGGIGQLDSSS